MWGITRLAVLATASAALAAVAATGARAEATTFTFVQNVPYENFTKSPCPTKQPSMEVTGQLHQTLHITVDDTGGMHLVNLIDVHFSGTGPTGVDYVGNATTIAELNDGGAFENTYIVDIRWVAKGETTDGDDFTTRLVNHVTVTPDGTVTSSVFDEDTRCY